MLANRLTQPARCPLNTESIRAFDQNSPNILSNIIQPCFIAAKSSIPFGAKTLIKHDSTGHFIHTCYLTYIYGPGLQVSQPS